MKKKELKSVVKQLLDAVAEQNVRLTKLEYPQIVEKKGLVAGTWYKGNYYDTKYLVFPTELHNEKVVEGYGFCDDGSWSVFNNDAGVGRDTRLAFSNEVESALIAEAKKRGHKYDAYSWNHEQNTLYGNRGNDVGHDILFENGVWSEVIKPEEKPNIGDVCKFWNYNEKCNMVGKLVRIYDVKNTNYPFATSAQSWMNAKTITPQEAIDLLFNK